MSAVAAAIKRTVSQGVMKVAAFNRNRLEAPSKPHPFLSGIHEPLTKEITAEALAVQGTIPPELDGRYVRIGPNPATPPNPAAYHWFTGDGMVHGVRLKGGQALWYRNRWVRSKAVSATLGETPAPGPRHGISDTVNTNVLGHAGKIWALVEAGGYPVELDENLMTVSHNNFEGSLRGAFTAHAHRDPDTGELHAVTYDARELNTIHHVVIGTDSKVRREEPLTVRHGPSIHDCALTQQYVLVFDLPVTFSLKTLLAGHPFPYTWNPKHSARVGLLPREGKDADIIWCNVDPCYVFHPCNAYETDDGKVIVDVVAHDTMFAESVAGPDSQKTTFERWTIDAGTKQVTRKVIDAARQEFPRPDERRYGKPYRYAYATPLAREDDTFLPDAHIIRHDLHTGTRQEHRFAPGQYPGEFVFVPRSAASAEDDGWLMGYVVNLAGQTTDLVILNANDFTGPPQAVITIPQRIPAGFHGNWIPAA